jgi:hypothetical protein
MKHKHLLRHNAVIICLALLLSGWGGMWRPTVLSGARASSAAAVSDDAERLKIALDVLESNAVALRQTYEMQKNCQALLQARDIAEALLVLAPAGSESYRRGKAEWDKINRLIPRCNRVGSIPQGQGIPGTTAGVVVIQGGGGCTNGLVAELLAQDSAFIQDYAERTQIKLDLTAIAGADRILLDVTPRQRNMAENLPYATIQAQCDPKAPGVKGMSEAIFSYFLMTQQQRDSWLQDIPQLIRDFVPGLPSGGLTLSTWTVGPFTPNPTRPAFWTGFVTPTPGARVTPFPMRTRPSP